MAQDWQKELPIHKLTSHDGKRTKRPVQSKMLWVSLVFRFPMVTRDGRREDSGEYQAKIWVELL